MVAYLLYNMVAYLLYNMVAYLLYNMVAKYYNILIKNENILNYPLLILYNVISR
jgi:hypothetical protein